MNVLQTWQRWTETFGQERHLIGASFFRIGAGLTLLYQYLINYHQRHYLYGPNAVWPYDRFLEKLREAGSFSLYAFSNHPMVFEAIFHLGILVTALWVLGWRTRIMTPLTYIFLWSLHERNPTLWDGGDNVLQIVMVYAIFANLGAHFSLDAERRREMTHRRPNTWQQIAAMCHNGAMLAFALQLCIVYATAGLYKVQGEMWQSGTALYYVMRVDEFTWPGYSERVYLNVPLIVASSYATVAFQVSFPFLFFLNRWTRRLALLAAFGFHLGIALFMGLITFSAIMISIELALVSDDEYRSLGRWFRDLGVGIWRRFAVRVVGPSHKDLLEPFRVQVFYDNGCPFCQRTLVRLQKLDWLGLLEPIPFRQPGVVEHYGLDETRIEARIQARSINDSEPAEGIGAFRLIASRLPALWPMWPFLYISEHLGIGQRLYDWVAARRQTIPVQCTSSCGLESAEPYDRTSIKPTSPELWVNHMSVRCDG